MRETQVQAYCQPFQSSKTVFYPTIDTTAGKAAKKQECLKFKVKVYLLLYENFILMSYTYVVSTCIWFMVTRHLLLYGY